LPRLISRWLFLPRPGDPPAEERLPLRPGVRLRVIKYPTSCSIDRLLLTIVFASSFLKRWVEQHPEDFGAPGRIGDDNGVCHYTDVALCVTVFINILWLLGVLLKELQSFIVETLAKDITCVRWADTLQQVQTRNTATLAKTLF
jgi:hypothetical protein